MLEALDCNRHLIEVGRDAYGDPNPSPPDQDDAVAAVHAAFGDYLRFLAHKLGTDRRPFPGSPGQPHTSPTEGRVGTGNDEN